MSSSASSGTLDDTVAAKRERTTESRPILQPYTDLMRRIRVAAVQLNVCVGDLDGNVELILDAYRAAVDAGVDLAVFSELTVTGYPPEDLLLKPAFVREAEAAVARLAAEIGDTVAIVGYPDSVHDLHNAAAILHKGKMVGSYHKQVLPNYSVFDEQRYFVPGTDAGPLYEIAGVRVGVTVCEDVWSPVGPYADQAAGGAELLVNINGSPFRHGKQGIRESLLETRAADVSVPIVYVNQVGGQDELVFDGGSVVVDQTGKLVARARQFDTDLLVVDIEVPLPYRARLLDPRGRRHETTLPVVELTSTPISSSTSVEPRVEPLADPLAETWQALVTATRDYTVKNGFSEAVIAMSGGVDSSIVAALAADALGPENVHGVSMPSRYSSDGSRDDAGKARRELWYRLQDNRDRGSSFCVPFDVVRVVRGHRTRHHRGEPAEQNPGRDADGAQQQVRVDGSDHG